MKESNYFEIAKNYLLSHNDIDKNILNDHLNDYKNKNIESICSLFKELLVRVQNRQSMPNSIGDINKLSNILFDFNNTKVLEYYGSWENVFDSIKNSEYSPPGRMVRENPRSHWVIFCKSIISICEFLEPYKSFNDFQVFVDGFLTNKQSKLALPLLIKEEIFGFGFALACDFLKENISSQFIKPDTHINDISRHLKITNSWNNYRIFKDLIVYCELIGVNPYQLDKAFWLIGSGNFYRNRIKIKCSKKLFYTYLEGL